MNGHSTTVSRTRELFRKIEKNRTSSALLRYNPDILIPGWENWEVRNITAAGGSINLTNGVDYILQMPAEPVVGTITVIDGRNWIMVGGEIDIDAFTSTSEGDQSGIRIYHRSVADEDLWSPTAGELGRKCFVEGVYIHGNHLADGIQFKCAEAHCYIQNVRYEGGMWGRESATEGPTHTSPHPDALQPWGNVGRLYVDKFTGACTYQGFQLPQPNTHNPNLLDIMELYRVNLKGFDTGNANLEINLTPSGDPETSGGIPDDRDAPVFMVWFTSTNDAADITVGDFYVDHPLRAFSDNNVFWPQGYTVGVDGEGRTYAEVQYVDHGRFFEGPPPNGDYVLAADVGLSYTSPGYQT